MSEFQNPPVSLGKKYPSYYANLLTVRGIQDGEYTYSVVYSLQSFCFSSGCLSFCLSADLEWKRGKALHTNEDKRLRP